MKKFFSLAVSIVVLFVSLSFPAYASQTSVSKVEPRLNNTLTTSTDFYIENGVATVTLSYTGYQGVTTGATIETKLQKRFLLVFWKDVDIGVDGNVWVDEATGVSYRNSHSVSVPSGTYRVQVEYEIRGTGGAADVITKEIEAKSD